MTLTKRDYIDYANQIAIKEGLDPAIFIAQLNQESGFNPKAKNSKSGAIGIAQFMPSTAKGMGFTAGVDPLRDIRMAAQYMKSKLKMYNGDYRLALASYNAGSGNVAKYGGVPPFKETQNYVNNIMSMAGKNNVLTGEVTKNDTVTGAASNLNIPNPERPNYRDLLAEGVKDPTGSSNARITNREDMALRNLAAPVQAPQDIRPMVQIGTNPDGTPQVITASQYNDLLNQLDTQRIMQTNVATQAQLPQLSKVEVQLGGQNAYDTMKGLRDEYNQAIANDPRWDLVRLTPEQALDAMNIMKAKQGAGTLGNIDKAQYYQMMNSLQNYQTPLNNAYDLTNQEYLAQLENMKQFQQTALTLAQGNQALAQELMKQAQAGNKNVIDALQKTQEARMKQETDYQKQIQSDYGTLLNTQRTGLNAYYNQLPQTEADMVKAQNQFNLGRYGADVTKYGTDVGTQKDLMMPQIQADVEARNPVTRAKLNIEQQRANAASQNANTAEAAAATNAILNSGFNAGGLNVGAGTVPSLNAILGNPTQDTRNALFGGGVLPNNSNNKTIDYFSLFNND